MIPFNECEPRKIEPNRKNSLENDEIYICYARKSVGKNWLGQKWAIPGLELSWNGTKNIGRVLNGILSLENEIFLAGASKSLKILKFLKKWQIVEKSQIHLFKTNVAEKTSRTLGTAHFIQIDIEYDWIYRHF